MYDKNKYVAHKADSLGNIPYTESENHVWKTLFHRQIPIVQGRACEEYIQGLERLSLNSERIPQPKEVTAVLNKWTQWGLESVESVIPASDFFALLSQKKFPAASFIRRPEELDYLQEPDIFHEVFGHCPLLTYKPYADFVEEYGRLALGATAKQRKYLFRIFWFTIEFGLMETSKGRRIYGGGILSSIKETQYALNNPDIKYLDFEVMRVLRTPFRIDIVQPLYFVIKGLEQMYDILSENIFEKVQQAIEMGDIIPDQPLIKDGQIVKFTN